MTPFSTTSHLESVRKCWRQISDLRSGFQQVTISGSGLELPVLVAVARYKVTPQLSSDEAVRRHVDDSVAFVVASSHGPGASMYGVNTGVGGSGATRTTNPNQLQLVILKNLCSGVLPLGTTPHIAYDPTFQDNSLILPESWVKGAMLLRLNSLLRGHSGCRWVLIECLHQLLVRNLVPCAPLRQSISASGDLAPLGYIAASLTETVPVQVWSGTGAERKRVPSIEALRAHGIQPITYGPKEALAVVNGTGPSCAVGALALHDANLLLLASQVLTALAVEALVGTPESFDPFIHATARPHPGQVEVARNERTLLTGSTLARWYDESDPLAEHVLRQDRYGLRTAPQWIGPQVEEALAAWRTIEVEMNSTTDNPIIDLQGQRSVHGGNFQGTSVALAMEKTRIGLQHLGKLAYAQLVELGSPSLNRGLPPDLAAWEPSLDFGIKTIDVATASYVSELSFVSNTVTNHVQAAEMHNQAVNSLALISARYTFTAIQLLQMIFANHLYSLCQALDLRALNAQFFTCMESGITKSLEHAIDPPLDSDALARLARRVFGQARVAFLKTAHHDSQTRFMEVVRPLLADVLQFLANDAGATATATPNDNVAQRAFNAATWHTTLASTLTASFNATRISYFEHGSAAPLLGNTRIVYRFVRDTLGVRMRTGLPRYDIEGVDVQVSKIYYAFESGTIAEALLEAME
ncbi:L-Aspartase-like protein [Gautieria morchelliformis]|nr:L-Aspartase-like protein [Gautieria morchelliformis]